MHFHFAFAARQILWTLTFAAQLVLLVVLLGRDRARRFPWFTASIALFAFRLLAEALLTGRMPNLNLQVIFLVLADLAGLVGLLVVMEVARRSFAGASRAAWIAGSLGVILVGGVILVFWGPWPAGRQLVANTPLAILRLMQLFAEKADSLTDLLTVEVGLLVVLLGRRFGAGWWSHPQQIAIGLSTVAAGWLTIQGSWRIVARTVHPKSQQEYEQIMALGAKLVNANKVIFLVALVWWILWLWQDEPGSATAAALPAGEAPADEEPSPAAE